MPANALALQEEDDFRPMPTSEAVRVIAVTSGKGGVGKTNVSVNLAVAMAQQGKRVMLMDGDLGLGNVDVLLGVKPDLNLSHVLDGRCALRDIIIRGPFDIQLVPAASGLQRMTELTPAEHAELVRAFSDIEVDPDVLLVDTAAGLSGSVVCFTRAAQDIVVVVCDEPASLIDAHALVESISRERSSERFRIHVLANMVRSPGEGKQLFYKLLHLGDRFLNVSLDYMGAVPFDECVQKAVQRQRAVIEAFPRSRSASAFKKLSSVTDDWRRPEGASGDLQFFLERLVHAGSGGEECEL